MDRISHLNKGSTSETYKKHREIVNVIMAALEKKANIKHKEIKKAY